MHRLRRWFSGGPVAGPVDHLYSSKHSSATGSTSSVTFQLPDGRVQRPLQRAAGGSGALVAWRWPPWCAMRKQRALQLDERYRSAANRMRIIHALKTAIAAALVSSLEVGG